MPGWGDGDEEDEDEDEEGDEDTYGEWNLRKSSASGLDVLRCAESLVVCRKSLCL